MPSGKSGDSEKPRREVEASFDLDLLDEAARRRVEEVIEKALGEELANIPLPEGLDPMGRTGVLKREA